MEEIVAIGRLPLSDEGKAALDTIMQSLSLNNATLFLEDQAPQQWTSRERQQGLRTLHLDEPPAVSVYSCGCLFDDAYELRWEPTSAGWLYVRYIGEISDVDGLERIPDLDLRSYQDTWYYLWGIYSQHYTQAIGAPVFLELRIPRLLQFPVEGERVRLCVRYYDQERSSQPLLYRFCRLVGADHSAKERA